jgi:transcriptional regulator with XRE-family HTH domain
LRNIISLRRESKSSFTARRSSTEREVTMVLVRQEIGDVLRDVRLQKGHTLRQVAGKASVALGYLSEVERGQKEASSEILAAIADALEVPVSGILIEAGSRLASLEGITAVKVPDTVPDELVVDFASLR